MAGISREHLNRIEAGKVKLTDDMQDKLMEAVEKFNPDAPMFLLFDYVRIRFPTLNIQHVIKDILEWIHTTINGKKYKRLWNASKGEWLTNWILEK